MTHKLGMRATALMQCSCNHCHSVLEPWVGQAGKASRRALLRHVLPPHMSVLPGVLLLTLTGCGPGKRSRTRWAATH